MAKVIGVDPGKTSGLAIFEEDGTPVAMGQMTLEEMVEFTNTYDEEVKIVVVETFEIFKRKAAKMAGSKVEASQVIGMMKSFAARVGAKYIEQTPDKKDLGAQLSGKFPPREHRFSHQFDAYNHAFFRLHEMGRVKSVLERQQNGEA